MAAVPPVTRKGGRPTQKRKTAFRQHRGEGKDVGSRKRNGKTSSVREKEMIALIIILGEATAGKHTDSQNEPERKGSGKKKKGKRKRDGERLGGEREKGFVGKNFRTFFSTRKEGGENFLGGRGEGKEKEQLVQYFRKKKGHFKEEKLLSGVIRKKREATMANRESRGGKRNPPKKKKKTRTQRGPRRRGEFTRGIAAVLLREETGRSFLGEKGPGGGGRFLLREGRRGVV